MRLVLIILLVAYSNCIKAQSLGSIISKAGGQLMQDLSNTDEWRAIGKAVETAGDMSYKMDKIKARNKEKIVIKTTPTNEKRLYPAKGYKWKNRDEESYKIEKVKNYDIKRLKKSKRLGLKALKSISNGSYNNALNLANQSIEEEKTYAGYLLRACIYLEQGKFKIALQDLGNALNFKLTDKKYKLLYLMKGAIHFQQNRAQKAIYWFNKIINSFNSNNDDLSTYYAMRGVSKMLVNKIKESKKDLTKSINLNPKNGYAHVFLGLVEILEKNHKKALKNLNKGISLIKNSSEKSYHDKKTISKAYVGRAKIYYKYYEKYKKALNNTNKALNMFEKLPEAYFVRCKSKIKLGFKEGGCLDCSKAKKLGLVEKVNKNNLYTENCR